MKTQIKGPIEYIRQAVKIYTQKENFIFFARIMAVTVIISTALGLIFGYTSGATYDNYQEIFSRTGPQTVLNIFLIVALAMLGLWTNSVTYMAVIKMGTKEKEIFKLGLKKIWVFLLITLTVGLIVGLGLILLIIPGIIFGTWFMFAIFLVMEKGWGVRKALSESKRMVKGKFWKVLGRSFIFGLISILVGAIVGAVPYAGSLITSFLAPVFMLPSYLLYKDLSKS